MSHPPLHLICDVPATALWRYINMDEYADADYGPHLGPKQPKVNPLLDPTACAKWVASVARSKSVDYTYGGYMEDRRNLWRGHYMKRGCAVHYGVDLNVPDYTMVCCPIAGRIVEVYHNADQAGGWGGRVTVETECGIVVFAHLWVFSELLRRVGKPFKAGELLGHVAESSSNGGWYPHLHLQGLRSLDQLTSDLDGYGKRYKGMERDYPNPLEILLPR